jgi:predicted lipid-binding transport protein (Tim44 family)
MPPNENPPTPYPGMPAAPPAPAVPQPAHADFISMKPFGAIAAGFLLGMLIGGWLGAAAFGSLFGLIAAKSVVGKPNAT